MVEVLGKDLTDEDGASQRSSSPGRRTLGASHRRSESNSGHGQPPVIVLAHPRDPGTFCGTDDVDIEDWLQMYERVSSHNRWDATLMLANVIFYLKGTAKVWFETHEAEITSWDICKEKLRDLFAKSANRQLAAKKELSTRAQSATESYITYIQDVLALCHKVDSQMSETEKVGHVLKGIADDAFNLLVYKNCSTVDTIITECRRFEEAKSRRITQQFTRLPNTAATSSCEDLFPPIGPLRPSGTESPSENLTRIIRREIEAITPATPSYRDVDTPVPTVAIIKNVIHEELVNLGLHPVCAISHPTPGSRRAFRDHAAGSTYGSPRYRPRNPAEWRTQDDKPICFNCERPGHIARYCQRRWSSPRQNNTSRIPHDGSRRFSPVSPPEAFDTPAQTYRVGRSPPPRFRRQSRSPRRPSPLPNYVRTSPEN